MLRGVSPLIGPELLATLHRMGHGDEIVFADAHFPAQSLGPMVIHADGLPVDALLDAVMRLLVLDPYVEAPLAMMAAVEGDRLDPAVESDYRAAAEPHHGGPVAIDHLDRFDFYDRAQRAFAVVVTGETRKYGNLIVKKGVTPIAD
ncbi:MAG: L-fucose mutarotase [Planctomycetota bacterium]